MVGVSYPFSLPLFQGEVSLCTVTLRGLPCSVLPWKYEKSWGRSEQRGGRSGQWVSRGGGLRAGAGLCDLCLFGASLPNLFSVASQVPGRVREYWESFSFYLSFKLCP